MELKSKELFIHFDPVLSNIKKSTRFLRNFLLGLIMVRKFPKKSMKLGSLYGSKRFSYPNQTIKWLISAGTGEDISFDIEFYNKFPCKIIFIDPTARAKKHIDDVINNIGQSKLSNYSDNGCQQIESYDLSNIIKDDLYFFNKSLYSDKLSRLKLYPPQSKEYVSYSILKSDTSNLSDDILFSDVISINTLVNEFQIVDDQCIIKLDIEGAEYEVIESMFQINFFPQQIIVEIDELYIDFPKYYKFSRSLINLILKNNYSYIANDHSYDFCFLKKPRNNLEFG